MQKTDPLFRELSEYYHFQAGNAYAKERLMLVLRTVVTTDWKNRPDHRIVLIAKGLENKIAAVAAMDNDILNWMAADIASQEFMEMNEDLGFPINNEGEPVMPDIDEAWELRRASELLTTKTSDEFEKKWAISGDVRYEMQKIQDKFGREFVETIGDTDLCTIVYHLMTDDFEPILD